MTRYFEDVSVGESHDLGEFQFSEADIVDFAAQYDPLFFHTDPDAAAEGFFGGLISSGWLTAVTVYGATAEAVLQGTSVVAGRGTDDMRFHRPVRPGDVFEARAEVVETRPESNPNHGLVRIRIEAHLVEGGPETDPEAAAEQPLIMSMEILPIFARREEGPR